MSNPEQHTPPPSPPPATCPPATTPPPAMDGEHGHGAPETGSISLPTIGVDVNLDASSSVPPQGGISDGGDVLHVSLNGASALLGSDTGASANSPSTLLSINADADTGIGGADIGSTLISKLFAAGPSALAHVQVGDAPSAPQGGGDGADIGANVQVGLGDTGRCPGLRALAECSGRRRRDS